MKAIFLVLACFLLSGVLFLPVSDESGPDMVWDMVNVNYQDQQGDAHVITIKNGRTILIDAGHWNSAGASLLKYLQERSINSLDMVFITHPHVDHYGGLFVLLDNGIKIKEVYFNLPDRAVCDSEIPWGCNYNEVLGLRQRLKDNGIVVKNAHAGQRFELGGDTWLEILYAFDGVNTPVGRTDVNDLSLIMMLHHKNRRFLFTGDLNYKIGSYLAGVSADLTADILKVPHHGTETTVPDSFFEKVAPRYAFVPAPAKLWQSERSNRIRKWFLNHHVPVYVNGLDGNVRAEVNGVKLMVSAQSLETVHASRQ